MDKKFILDIVPLTKIPLSREQYFCYFSDKKLAAGSLVSAPLFKRKTEGIVIETRNDFKRLGGIDLKKIDEIIEEKFLTKEQIKLARFISDYYISPLGIVMKSFAPKRTKIRNKKIQLDPSFIKIQKEKSGVVLTEEQRSAVDKIVKKNIKYLLFGPPGSGKTEICIQAIKKLKERSASRRKSSQFLILLPEKTLISPALERYGAYFNPEEIAVLSSNVSKGQFYANWKKIKSGEAKIIIGTRLAVLAPFKKLGLIVIDEEQDMSYKQWDMNPRYDARTAAEKLAEIHKCPIVRSSVAPSVESYWRAKNKDLELLELSLLLIADSPLRNQSGKSASFQIVDMKKERWNKNFSCVSRQLQGEIAYALKHKQQMILFVNRQGMSHFSICENCKTVLKCPYCDRSLVYDEKGYYRCVHCAYKTSVFPRCPKCGQLAFKNIGVGTQKVEKEIKSFFPGVQIARLDSQIAKISGFQEKIYREFSEKKIDALIGTQMVSKGWDLPALALVGIIDADNALSFPDLYAKEKFYQNIVQLSGRVSRPGSVQSGKIVIQTFQPENDWIKMAASRDWKIFFENEIQERKALNFPPFGKVIKLIFKDFNFSKAESETRKVFEILEKIVSTSEPIDSFLPKIRGRFRKQIILKSQSFSLKLKKELKKLGSGWIIDVDPVSII